MLWLDAPTPGAYGRTGGRVRRVNGPVGLRALMLEPMPRRTVSSPSVASSRLSRVCSRCCSPWPAAAATRTRTTRPTSPARPPRPAATSGGSSARTSRTAGRADRSPRRCRGAGTPWRRRSTTTGPRRQATTAAPGSTAQQKAISTLKAFSAKLRPLRHGGAARRGQGRRRGLRRRAVAARSRARRPEARRSKKRSKPSPSGRPSPPCVGAAVKTLTTQAPIATAAAGRRLGAGLASSTSTTRPRRRRRSRT